MAGSSKWSGILSIRKKLRPKAAQVVAQEQAQVEAPPAPEIPAAATDVVGRVLVDSYSVYEPFVRIAISLEPDGTNRYIVVEPRLTKTEKKLLREIKDALKNGLELDVGNFKPEEAEAYLTRETLKIMKRFGIRIPKFTFDKLFYFIRRDYLHYAIIDPLMRDPNIEDISCNGPGTPIYVFQRNYESIPTSVSFKSQDDLEKFIMRMAYMSGKHISVSEPVVDASLPEGSRIQMTFGTEITKKGSTFTIRKFKEDPYSVIDLVRFGTLDSEVAALFWYLLENKGSVLLAGGTASGKSILGSEDILIYQEGAPRLFKISELFDGLAKTRSISNEGGYEVIKCGGIETAAFDRNLKVQPFRVKAVIRHPAPSHVFKVRTRTGREVTVTGAHSIFTLMEGRVQPYPVSELEPGMFLAVPRTLPEATTSASKLNLIEAFAEEDWGLYVDDAILYVKNAIEILGMKAVQDILRLGHKSLLIALNHHSMAVRVSNLVKLANAANLDVDPSGLSIRAKNYRRGAVPALIPVSKDLMRFLGYWVSEGMYGEGLKLFSLDVQVRQEIYQIVKRILGLEVRYHKQDRTRMDINSRALEMVFRHVLGLEGGAGRKKIPSLVLEQPNELLVEFLKAYYTGDGYARNYVEAVTKSGELAHQLLYALSRLGIVAQMTPKIVGKETYHRVYVYGRKNLERFSESVGFLNRENQRRLGVYLSRKSPVHTNIDTIPGIAPLLKQCLQFKSGVERKELWGNWHSYWSSEKRIGHQTLASFVERTGAQGELRDTLLTLAYSDLFWDEVTEVEELECKDSYVYDLEVPGAQNFVGGSGGLFLHNTTSINCLALFIRPEAKIVTIEDTPEINLAHSNWIESISRQGTAGIGEVTLYDLLRAALRQRPDFIIVGEVRGEEAYTMFQALSTGHAGLSSIHADSIAAVFHRLTNPPMNIPRTLIPAVNLVVHQARITLNGKPVRRMLSVTEIVGLDTRSSELITNEVYRYDTTKDRYIFAGRSYVLEKMAKDRGVDLAEIKAELATRSQIVQWMAKKGLRQYREVANVIQRYYTDKAGLLAEIGAIVL